MKSRGREGTRTTPGVEEGREKEGGCGQGSSGARERRGKGAKEEEREIQRRHGTGRTESGGGRGGGGQGGGEERRGRRGGEGIYYWASCYTGSRTFWRHRMMCEADDVDGRRTVDEGGQTAMCTTNDCDLRQRPISTRTDVGQTTTAGEKE